MVKEKDESKAQNIISASRRTDIPAFYSDWFFKRLEEGFVSVRNPMNPGQIRQVSLKREAVSCFVFWTRNPGSMLPKLDLLQDYPYYFQFTLNGYGEKLEPYVPSISDAVSTFVRLSDMIGPERVIWRYDPVILCRDMDVVWHERRFSSLADKLRTYTGKCIISFIDYYKKIDKCFKDNAIKEPELSLKRELAERFAVIAADNGLRLLTCSEEIELSDLGIGHASCIDPELIKKLSGESIKPAKDRNQRSACGCCPSVDIGTYNTCLHGCTYCYANHGHESVRRNAASFYADSPSH